MTSASLQPSPTARAVTKAPPHRNPNIDALRAVAVLMVLGRHVPYFPLWTKTGWAGVDLFFVISGYLVSGLLFAEWKTTRSIKILRFYVRRAFKIYPAFYTLLAVTLLLHAIHPGLPPFPVSVRSLMTELFFLQSYFQGIWGHTWSLAVEEHFYLLLPLVLCVLQARKGSEDPFRSIPAIFVVVAAIAMGLRCATDPAGGYRVYLAPTHLRIDALLFGVTLRYYRAFQPEMFTRIQQSRTALFVVVLATFLLLTIRVENRFMHTAGFTVVFLGFGVVLVHAVDFRPSRYSGPLIRALASIGVYSYSIYLWHFAIARVMIATDFAHFGLYITLCLALGVLAAALIELPLLRVRDYYYPSRSGFRG